MSVSVEQSTPERKRSAPNLGGDSICEALEFTVGLTSLPNGYPHTACDLPRSAGHVTGNANEYGADVGADTSDPLARVYWNSPEIGRAHV